MIKITNEQVVGLEPAVRGMRNPKNSWSKSDSCKCSYDCLDLCEPCDLNKADPDHYNYSECGLDETNYILGPNDLELAEKLAKGGPVHAKYRRMIVVYVDILAPLYWWKEFDTYKVGTVANSCSTMHKIAAKEFTRDDFSHEHLFAPSDHNLVAVNIDGDFCHYSSQGMLSMICDTLNHYRELYLKTKAKDYWWQMIQLLPSSYNQKRTVMLNYEVLAGIYPMRKRHKLNEWRDFCKWIEQLPYAKELIIGEEKED